MQIRLRTAILPTLAIVLLILTFNIDVLLKNGINTFTPLKIYSLDGTRLNWPKISFENIHLSYQDLDIALDNIVIGFELKKSDFLPIPHPEKISINTLSLKFTDTEKSGISKPGKKTSQIRVSDYRPQIIHQQLNNLKLEIKRIEITRADLFNQVLVFNNFSLNEMPESKGKIKLATDFIDPESEQSLSLSLLIGHHAIQENYTLKILFNDTNKIKVDLDFDFNEKNINNEQFFLNTHIELHADKNINSLLKNYLPVMSTLDIKQFHSDIKLQASALDVIDIYKPEQALIENKIETETEAHIHFKDQLVTEFILKSHFQIKGERNESGEYLQTLFLPRQNLIKLLPNTAHEFFNSSASLAFLSQHPIKIDVLDNSVWHMQADEHTRSLKATPALAFRWSKSGNNAYLDTQLEHLAMHVSASHIITDLAYTLSGRWDRYFSNQHTGKLTIDSSITDKQHTLKAVINDLRLHSIINFFAQKNKDQYTGNFDISIPEFSKATTYVNEMLSYWNDDLKLLSGGFSTSGDFKANKSAHGDYELTYTMNSSLTNINLDYDGFLFHKLDSDASFKGRDSQVKSVEKFPIRVKKIDAGVILNNFEVFAQLDFDFKKDSKIFFSNLSTQLLGGTMTGADFSFYLPKTPDYQDQAYHSEFTLLLDNIHLSALLALADNPEIQGQGLLEGKLPIYIDEKRTLIKHGYLKNKGDGRIRFLPDQASRATLKQNPQMALLISVLTHLNYDQLSADVDLDAKGLMQLQGSIQGLNPDFKQGYPIHFNPSIELNFSDMLRSLQISDSISKNLRSRVNKKKLD